MADKRIQWKCVCGEWVANLYLCHTHVYIEPLTLEFKKWTYERKQNDETREV